MENGKTDRGGLPGTTIAEYKLVICPHEDLSKKLQFIQSSFAERFALTNQLPGRPQLLICRFKQMEAFEPKIVQRLQQAAGGHSPFKAEIRDFGSSPSHTIYANVVSPVSIKALVTTIKTQAQSLMKLDADNKPYFISESHFIIASKLKPWQYEKGWLEMQHEAFSAGFIVNEILLMKRKEGETKYQLLRKFSLLRTKEQTSQGQLF